MSKDLAEKNSESTALLFNKRVYYARRAISGYSSLEAFEAEKYMYGRVNRRFVPMFAPSKNSWLFKTFAATNAQADNIRALNFVVDAFKDMAQQFRKCALLEQIDTQDPYLTSLKVYKAYENPQTRYQTYIHEYNSSVRSAALGQINKIDNFEDFTAQLIKGVEGSGHRTPLTFPAYVKNKRCPITISGLAIEIADLDPSNDAEKVTQFLDNNNWEFFLNAAATYGFMVDKRIPWRLVADIGSSVMVGYASKYGHTSTDAILKAYYNLASPVYYASFAQRLLNMYNFVKPEVIQYTEECGNKTILRSRTPRNYGSITNFKKTYKEEFFLKLYCRIRFMEEESQFTENQKKLLIDDVIEISKIRTKYAALDKFELFLNKPFDYEGSIGYYIKRQQVREEAPPKTWGTPPED